MPDDDPGMWASVPPAESPRSSLPAAEIPGPQGYSGTADNQDQPRPDPGTDAVDAVAPEVPKARARLPRRLTIPLVLALASLAAGVWAIVLFPDRPPVTNPTAFTIDISNYQLSDISLTIFQSPQSAELAFQLYGKASPDKTRSPEVFSISNFGALPISCPSDIICVSDSRGSGVNAIFVTPITAGKFYYVIIKDPQFGAAGNGESAIADLPGVQGVSPNEATKLSLYYNLPDANTYDWSLLPTSYPVAGQVFWTVFWTETLDNPITQAQPTEITGTNPQVEAQDNTDTFISGILLGVAGAAAIVAIQEGLHTLFDNRDDNKLPKPA